MDIQTSLFEAQRIRLAPIDHEKDAEVESAWTHDVAWMRALGPQAARPLSPAKIKKKYEAIEKEIEESRNTFYFTIRRRGEDSQEERLIGFARIYWIEWSHGSGSLMMAIGSPEDRNHGYGREALDLVLRYAFAELNLYRLSAVLGEDNPGGLRFFQRAGFSEEVRRRQALHRDGRFYDVIHLGLLAEEWWQRLRSQEG